MLNPILNFYSGRSLRFASRTAGVSRLSHCRSSTGLAEVLLLRVLMVAQHCGSTCDDAARVAAQQPATGQRNCTAFLEPLPCPRGRAHAAGDVSLTRRPELELPHGAPHRCSAAVGVSSVHSH